MSSLKAGPTPFRTLGSSPVFNCIDTYIGTGIDTVSYDMVSILWCDTVSVGDGSRLWLNG